MEEVKLSAHGSFTKVQTMIYVATFLGTNVLLNFEPVGCLEFITLNKIILHVCLFISFSDTF